MQIIILKLIIDTSFVIIQQSLILALEQLPESINAVYESGFTKMAMNVLNVDLDNDNNPTDVTFTLDIDTLRKCVFDFRNL